MPSTDLATRALIVALKSPLYGKTSVEIEVQTGVKERTINNIYARAIKAGFDPNARPMIICNEWLADKPRSGRPAKLGDELNQIVTEKVSTDRYGREKSAAQIADEISQSGAILVSESTVWRTLRQNNFNKTKPTRKPGLTEKMRADRLQWCLAH